MNKQAKKLFTSLTGILLVVVMLMGMLPTFVLAAEADTSAETPVMPKIVGYNWVLDGILSVNFKVDAQGHSMDGYSVRVAIGSSAAQDITAYTREGELYVYTAKVMAHRLGEELTVSLCKDGEVIQTASKSLALYAAAQDKGNTALQELLSALQSYGAYAAYYKDAAKGLKADPAVEAVTADDLAGFVPVVSSAGIAELQPTVSLYLAEACDLQLKLDAAGAQGNTLYVNGEAIAPAASGSRNVYSLKQLLPQNWDQLYRIELKDAEGKTLLSMQYSVLSYIRAALNANTGDTALQGLMKAMYLYWSKAEAYIAGNAAVDTPILGITLPVNTENDIITEAVSYENIYIPAGVKVESGLEELTVSIVRKGSSDSSLAATDTKTLNAYDVHIAGIAADNTVPVQVELAEILPENLNSSALQLGHVENGQTVAMTYVPSDAELTAHNQFRYDPATGSVVLAMASFSEVALLVDTTNPWDGTADKTWYDSNATTHTIRNAQQLAGFAQIVTEGDSFAGETVKLDADIDLSGGLFYPIGYWTVENGVSKGAWGGGFSGTFDGQGHTVGGLSQNGWSMSGDYTDSGNGNGGYYNETMGLFGYLENAAVRNLNLDNFFCQMEFAPMGTVAGLAAGNCSFTNITVTNSDLWTYNTTVAGIVGCDVEDGSSFTFTNVTVDDTNTMHALWGTWDAIAGGILGLLKENSTADFNGCNVACVLDVYNDFCGNYQWGIYRYCGMFIGAVKKTTTDASGRSVCDLSNVTATNCTVNFGDWSQQYYYCEFEKNSMASYSPYYQFSRIPFEDVVFENGVAVGCQNHAHTENEKEHAWQFVFDAVFGSYGNWGVSPQGLDEYPAITVSDITKSTEKFDTKVNGTAAAPYTLYNNGNSVTVNVGSLFSVKNGVQIDADNVYISITKVNEDDTVAVQYTANSDWTQGSLSFTGTGLVKLTVQDYQYCIATELYVQITDNPISPVVGVWQTIQGNRTLTLNADGTGTYEFTGAIGGGLREFTWTYENGELLFDGLVGDKLSFTGDAILWRPRDGSYDYSYAANPYTFGAPHDEHEAIEVAEEPATCTETGTAAHWICEVCDKIFRDEACTEEVTTSDLILSKLPHSAVYVEEVPATETTEGTIAHWYCQSCDQSFADQACTDKLTAEDMVIPAGGTAPVVPVGEFPIGTWVHENNSYVRTLTLNADGTGTYNRDDKDSDVSFTWTYADGVLAFDGFEVTDFSWVDGVSITFRPRQTGYDSVGAIAGAYTFTLQSGSTNQPDEPETHTHSGTHYSEVPPTATASGMKEYWICSCGKYFSDAACINEVTYSSLVIPATGEPDQPDVPVDPDDPKLAKLNGKYGVNSTSNPYYTVEFQPDANNIGYGTMIVTAGRNSAFVGTYQYAYVDGTVTLTDANGAAVTGFEIRFDVLTDALKFFDSTGFYGTGATYTMYAID